MNIDYAKRAAKAYKADGANAQFRIIEGGTHMFSKEHDILAIEILKQFAK